MVAIGPLSSTSPLFSVMTHPLGRREDRIARVLLVDRNQLHLRIEGLHVGALDDLVADLGRAELAEDHRRGDAELVR